MLSRFHFCYLIFIGLLFGCGQSAIQKSSPLNQGPRLGNEGWVSAGGDAVGDSINPWFIQNTKDVNYCILSSSEFSDLPLSKIVKASLSYWAGQFQFANRYAPPIWFGGVGGLDRIEIATQNFHELPCDEKTDVRYQFGVLDDDQFSYLKDPTSHIAIAVRTSYDREQMRGKGFLYFSPDSGPRRYRGKHLLEQVYHMGEGGKLEVAVTHETGHFMGLGHAPKGQLMHVASLEQELMKGREMFGKELSPHNSSIPKDYFRLDHHLHKVSIDIPEDITFPYLQEKIEKMRKGEIPRDEEIIKRAGSIKKSALEYRLMTISFFGLPVESRQFEVVPVAPENNILDIYWGTNDLGGGGEPAHHVGRVLLDPTKDTTKKVLSMVSFYIKEIPLFEKEDMMTTLSPVVHGPGFVYLTRSGAYESDDGTIHRDITITFRPYFEWNDDGPFTRRATLEGVLDGHTVQPVTFW